MLSCFYIGKIYNMETNNDKMKIPIVNEKDEVIAMKERNEISSNDIYRVSSLWITNSKGEILLARRAWSKNHDPGKWGPAVAGTVEDGETYGENITKEAEEELGLKNIKPISGPKLRKVTNYNYFVQQFNIVLDKDITEFKIRKDEISEIKWFTPEELRKELKKSPENFLKGVHDRMKE